VLVLPATHAKKRFGSSEPDLTDSNVLRQIRDLLAEGRDSARTTRILNLLVREHETGPSRKRRARFCIPDR
jgi:hypothetical protein